MVWMHSAELHPKGRNLRLPSGLDRLDSTYLASAKAPHWDEQRIVQDESLGAVVTVAADTPGAERLALQVWDALPTLPA